MIEVSRSDYIEVLNNKRHNRLVKIVTGARRVGKSYLLFTLFRRFLSEEGVSADQIVSLALDDFKNKKYLDPAALYNYVADKILPNKPCYILLDEIQLVEDFESVLNGFLHIENADVYVTGSNSRFLSSDIITEFRGRGDEIRVYPFSFAEYYSVVGGDKAEAWSKYVRYGGMPQTLNMQTEKEKEAYLKGLFNQMYFSDIINRYNLRGQAEIEVLTNVLSSSVGSLTNPKKICDTLASKQNIKVSQTTIDRYLSYLEDAFLVSRAMRYDVKGRRYIGTPVKYYFVDVGLRNARINFRQQEETHLMENVIYNELLRRGFSVDVGVVGISEKNKGKLVRKQLEVDFVANMGSKRYYIQSSYSLADEEKVAQEKKSLVNVGDSFKKIIVQRSPMKPWHDEDGILRIDIFDFLLNKESIDW